jgi:birA, biotin-[acetyl-CoA-carboxylase] ligase region
MLKYANLRRAKSAEGRRGFFRRGDGRGKGPWKKFFCREEGRALFHSFALSENRKNKPLSASSALAAVLALAENEIKAEIKWPNDIILNGKKLGGILCEGKGGRVLIGIGINIENDVSSVPVATSLKEEGFSSVSAEKLAVCIIKHLYIFEKTPFSEFLDLYRPHCLTLGQKIKITETGETGTAKYIDEEGYLVLDNGIRAINPVILDER